MADESAPGVLAERVEDPATKHDLVLVLRGLRHGLTYGLVVENIATRTDIPADIDGKRYGLETSPGGPLAVAGLSGLAEHLRLDVGREVIRGNFLGFLFDAFLRMTHEIVLQYCERTNQIDRYRRAPFFQFVRIARNLVSHHDGAVLRQWPPELTKKGITSVRWRNRTLDDTQVGQVVKINPGERWQLHEDIATYVVEELL